MGTWEGLVRSGCGVPRCRLGADLPRVLTPLLLVKFYISLYSSSSTPYSSSSVETTANGAGGGAGQQQLLNHLLLKNSHRENLAFGGRLPPPNFGITFCLNQIGSVELISFNVMMISKEKRALKLSIAWSPRVRSNEKSTKKVDPFQN